jgi:Na+-transporting NADH:ubiquinone oxidoreductase subunit NqrB
MTELTLFASTFVLVFALGLQSINVNNGHYVLAALTSFVIGAGQMVLYKLAPNAGWTDIAAYLCGGPFGIIAAMHAHPYLARIIKRGKA